MFWNDSPTFKVDDFCNSEINIYLSFLQWAIKNDFFDKENNEHYDKSMGIRSVNGVNLICSTDRKRNVRVFKMFDRLDIPWTTETAECKLREEEYDDYLHGCSKIDKNGNEK